jgi:pimeloyl-ACP methyl ester carboxylesterase
VLGFSIGGYVAQALTLRDRERVRRLVLAGTKPVPATTQTGSPT